VEEFKKLAQFSSSAEEFKTKDGEDALGAGWFGEEWDGKSPLFSEAEMAEMQEQRKKAEKPPTAEVLAELFPDASQADLAEAAKLCDADDTEGAATLLVTKGAKAPAAMV
jgi:hypothetical protein